MSREAMKQALDFLEALHGGCTDSDDGTVEAITVYCPEIIVALRAALDAPEPGPVFNCPRCGHCCPQPAAQWVGLTEEDALRLWAGDVPRPVLGKNKVVAYARAIEAKLKEKNT